MAGTFVFPDDVPTLTDGEVTLRAHRPSDVDEMVVQRTDPEYGFAIEAPHADGVRRFAGSCGLRLLGEGKAEITFGLHPDARSRGTGTRAVKLLLDWGFQQPGIDVVVWFAPVGDWGSRRVVWSNGFSIDATLARFVTQRGEWTDTWFGTLRADDTREPKTPWHIAPVLETDRLRLRPLRETDADRMGEMLADERTQAFVGRYLAGDKVDPVRKIRKQLDLNARGQGYNWCIADRETDQLIGHIHLWDLGGFDPTSAQLGYGVHPDARGRGVLTASLGLVVDWAFLSGGFRRVFLGTAASNAASRHAAEKAGFTHIASEPSGFPTGESGFEDLVTYHRLNPDWTP